VTTPYRPARVVEPELLDTLTGAEVHANLRDLVVVNRWLGGHRLLPRLVAQVARPGESFTILDVGAASGDMGASVMRRFPAARVISLDRDPTHLARAADPRVAADAFAMPFADRAFDIVTANLFLHHFPDAGIVQLLSTFARLARRAVIVLDLLRHPVAYHFIPATRGIFGWHSISLHDGPASVQAGFQPAELLALAQEAGLGGARVRRHQPWFRVSVVARVDGTLDT
jgi:2-polyprenyl-3-methyl-5-hydroxy-6-metoxy-1,4-benzoquinol methylase